MSIDFVAIEDALFAAAKQSTGFADADIFFDSQDGVSPAPTPYVTIRLGDLINVGRDGRTWDYDAARPAGEEIHRTSQGMRTMTVTFSFFTPATVGSSTARTFAAKFQADLALPSIREPLNAAGLGILEQGNVRWVPKINDTDFEGRAILEVVFAIPQGSFDKTGWISKVNATPTIDGVVLPDIVIGS